MHTCELSLKWICSCHKSLKMWGGESLYIFIGEIEKSTIFSVHKIRVSRPPREGGEKGSFEDFSREFSSYLTPASGVGVGDPDFVDRTFCGRLDFAEFRLQGGSK